VLVCCADPRLRGTKPDVSWNPNGYIFGRRSYAMVGVGPGWQTEWQVPVGSANGKFVLPKINMGVGIYWYNGVEDADAGGAPSYKSSVIKDPSGTFILAEESYDQNIANDQWPCICLGPVFPNNGNSAFYQIDYVSPAPNFGKFVYKSHTGRFNYLYHDAHVEALRYEQTIGRGTTNAPQGMWTISPKD
jgi:prepilin-type processing-associated H-X9-DG protein